MLCSFGHFYMHAAPFSTSWITYSIHLHHGLSPYFHVHHDLSSYDLNLWMHECPHIIYNSTSFLHHGLSPYFHVMIYHHRLMNAWMSEYHTYYIILHHFYIVIYLSSYFRIMIYHHYSISLFFIIIYQHSTSITRRKIIYILL
jgi:hypothetical protein